MSWWGPGICLRIANIGCTIIIAVLSLLPDEASDGSDLRGILGSLDHMVAYTVLMSLWLLDLGKRLNPIVIAIAIVVYGGILELLQGAIPTREPGWLDMVANISGVLLGWTVAMTLRAFTGRRT